MKGAAAMKRNGDFMSKLLSTVFLILAIPFFFLMIAGLASGAVEGIICLICCLMCLYVHRMMKKWGADMARERALIENL